MDDNGKLKDNKEKLFHTIAHELGHGPFGLEHVWQEKGTTQGGTYNLMDYTDKKPNNLLRRYQWYYIHNPKMNLLGGDEEETSSENSNFVIIDGSIPDIEYKYRNNSIGDLGYIDIVDPYSFITPAGYPIKIDNVQKVRFSINGGVLNFEANGEYYFGVTQGNTFRGYIPKGTKDKIFPSYSEGTKETTFKISQKQFTEKEENIFESEKLKIGNIINNVAVNDLLFSYIKKETIGKYLDCILKVKWENRLGNTSGNYTGDSPPFTIQEYAQVTYIEGNQCDPKYENNSLDIGVGKTIFYFQLVKLISTDKEIDDLTAFCNYLSACSTYPFYFADKEHPENYTETASSLLCEFLYENKIISQAQFDIKFKKYEARGKPFYSTTDLYSGLKPDYNLNSVDFTTLELEADIEKLNNKQLSYIEYFKRVFEELAKEYAERYVYSFKDLAVRHGLMNNYEADYSLFGDSRSVITEYILGLENTGMARAVCADEEVKQYSAQFGTDQAFWLGASYLEEIQIADAAVQGNLSIQKFAIRKNLFTDKSGVANGYRRSKIVIEESESLAKGGSILNKVVLGSEDLSQFAINFRKTLAVPNHKGNVAVFEYLDNSGNLVKKAFTTEVGVASHSEELAIDFFTSQNIPKANIKRIYSELEPCELAGHTCKAKLTENFPTAQKVFSYNYPGGVDNTIRAASVNQRYIDLEQLLK